MPCLEGWGLARISCAGDAGWGWLDVGMCGACGRLKRECAYLRGPRIADRLFQSGEGTSADKQDGAATHVNVGATCTPQAREVQRQGATMLFSP